ncbi:GntR family transcriptional regulator, partial [Escherichia coli]|nr:GntR family transcriptional regulator [Escherichia coli]
TPKLGKIKLLSAKEQVAAELRKAILSRELVEGQEITLEGIARLVGVSSMPVREEFQILSADVLIHVRPNNGAVVLGINEQTIREHYEIR